MKSQISVLLIFLLPAASIAQEYVWANKVEYSPNKLEYYSDDNYPELMLGPTAVYPSDIHAPNFDEFTEGYILWKGRKSKVTFTFSFPKVINANQVYLGGVLNTALIRSIHLVLKDKKEKQVYPISGQSADTAKVAGKSFGFKLETVYGLKVVIDHSKINKWCALKGIALSNQSTLVAPTPTLPKDTSELCKVTKENLGPAINSKECAEFFPRISIDGSIMYFAKQCTNTPVDEIWYSELNKDNTWAP